TNSTCGTGACTSLGQLQCTQGNINDTCSPGIPALNDSGCDGIDDNCNGQTDEEFISIACGEADCTGNTQCLLGQESCTAWNTGCTAKKCCQCNGGNSTNPLENFDGTQNTDCSVYSLPAVATCDWTPDTNPFTWDDHTAITSQCIALDTCSFQTGYFNFTHTCNDNNLSDNIAFGSGCNASCDANDDCTYGVCKNDCTCVMCTDIDADGYGNPASPYCSQPWLDCNDNSSRINPGKQESCSTAYDDNCNGVANEGCTPGWSSPLFVKNPPPSSMAIIFND
ncbi:MAG: MopE-related protein, partial [Nanoarchaeota archaeon]